MKKLLAFTTLCMLAAPALAGSGGTIEGLVHYAGNRPMPPPTPVPKSMAACGKSKPEVTLLVAADHGLANAVVSVPGVAGAPKPPPKEGQIDQKECVYSPHVQALPVGSTLTFVNSDSLLHNVHARRGDTTLANLAMPIPGQHMKAPPMLMAKAGVVAFKCDAGHTWMSAYIHAFEHPFYAVSDAQGAFRIEGVPPGTYTLEIEHELLGKSTHPVTVTAGAVAHVDIELK